MKIFYFGRLFLLVIFFQPYFRAKMDLLCPDDQTLEMSLHLSESCVEELFHNSKQCFDFFVLESSHNALVGFLECRKAQTDMQ